MPFPLAGRPVAVYPISRYENPCTQHTHRSLVFPLVNPFSYFSSFSVLARFLSHFTWTFWLRASDDWSRARDRTTREAYGILNTAPELIGEICPFFMYICIILLSFQKQITVEIKLHAICLPRGPNFNDININKLVKSIDYLTAYWYTFRFGDSRPVFHKL